MPDSIEVRRPAVVEDIAEMIEAMSAGRMPDLNMTQLGRMGLAVEVLRVGIDMTEEYTRGMQANAAALNSYLLPSNSSVDNDVVLEQGDTVSVVVEDVDSTTGSVEIDLNDSEPVDMDRSAAEVVGSLILGSVASDSDTQDNDETPTEPTADNPAVVETQAEQEELGLDEEAYFILRELQKLGEIRTVTKEDLNAAGFEGVKNRASAASYQTSFSAATRKLRDLGLMQCPQRGQYELTQKGLETFLA